MTDTNERSGLTDQQVQAARQTHGWNELPTVRRAGPVRVLLRQFSNLLVLILIAAAAIAVVLAEYIDAAAIGLVIVLNAALGFVQEWKAETALASLRKLMSPQAMVIRNGREQVIPTRDVVPGDLVVLAPGAKVPADADLITAIDLSVDESILTGESVPVRKDVGDDTAHVFASTSITSGRAEACVTKTGLATQFGQIAQLTGSADTKITNLQHKLGQLARQLGIAALLVAAAVSGLGIAVGRNVGEMVMTGLSLSVAMVPEGLPAVVTITLALGATAMVRKQALARRLQAVETLGAASVICTDKTGTLTENKMTATQVWTVDATYEVTGTGYDPAGHIAKNGRRVRAKNDPVLAALLQSALLCNHATLNQDDGSWEMLGAPTEGALVTLAHKGWCDPAQSGRIIAEIPFSSTRKCMSVLYQSGNDTSVLTKGAPEQILDMSSHLMTESGVTDLTQTHRDAITAANTEMAQRGLRIIALARCAALKGKIVEEDMTFLGLVGIIDPPRPEVRDAILLARDAGIRVLMITGDSPITAQAIADQLSLNVARQMTGQDLDRLDDAALTQALLDDVLFARTRPEQKMRVVSALQAQDQIVAMTGDGVNDAPALKQADIGVSMGIRGTDVARDASDLVLLDDNFATIVSAISEGRRQFANVQKFVRYLLSSNAGEVVALVINIAIGGPLVFLATQILWMNLVTDGVTAVALGLEKPEPDQMQHPPRDKDTAILGVSGVVAILLLGTYTGLSSLWIFFHLMDLGVDIARTTAFTAMVVFEKVSVFAFRSLRLPGWRIGWFSNPFLMLALAVTLGAQLLAVYWPPLQILLHTTAIGVAQWQWIGLFALPIVIVPEVIKAARSRDQRTTS